MGASSYKKILIGNYELGDGTKLRVKRLKPSDFVENGVIPDVLYSPEMKDEEKMKVLQDKKTLEGLYKVAFLKGVIPQDDFVPVDKPESELAENEICVELLTDTEKAGILIKAVQGGVGEEPNPFQDNDKK